MNTYMAHLAATEPNDADSRAIRYTFDAASEHDAREIARQFTAEINAGRFAGFVLIGVELVHGALAA